MGKRTGFVAELRSEGRGASWACRGGEQMREYDEGNATKGSTARHKLCLSGNDWKRIGAKSRDDEEEDDDDDLVKRS